jgi:hypothetical protein
LSRWASTIARRSQLSGAMQFGLSQVSKGVAVGFDVTVVGYEY